MGDRVTPSATAVSPSNVAAEKRTNRPEKPDEEAFKANLAKTEKEHAAVMERLNAIRDKVNLAQPNKGSPTAQRQSELRSQLTKLRTQQQGFKASKGSLQEKIRSLDATLKSRIAEQNTAKSRVPFKNVEEIDREIQRLEKQVDTGTMKLVDEKKALSDMSNLRKQRKGFAGFEEAQKGIDEIKTQLKELRKGLEDPEAKAVNERYTAIAKELDDIRAEQDEAHKNISSLRDERTKIQAEQQEKYSAIRALKDDFYAQKKAYADYEHQAFLARKERQKAERENYEREKRRKIADKKLEEASEPAYMDEILTAEGLIRYFDPSYVGTAKSSGPSKFAAQASRTVDDPILTGTRVIKKEDREDEYFVGIKGKKGKKVRKGGAAAEGGKFSLSIGVLEELAKVRVEPPMSQSGVPHVVEKLKQKLEQWKVDQAEKTKENIARAQKEIERLEAEPLGPGTPPQSLSGGRRNKDGAKKGKTTAGSDPASPANEDGNEISEATGGVESITLEEKV
ncbi:hypothetical protein FGG08_004858 [Glutinoglossum americanum]|uniref:Nuclear segregation protein n=1 Tax=Glutinoglossum americanum TaxID=1670608 RepID=A0A9P8IAK9_9PEZI|nr:hypothetical protein FGG08_004858 [Glutinoglossum americanum]